MSLCPLTRILAPLALAMVVVAGVARAETPAKTAIPVLKVYQVADLVIPIPGMAVGSAGDECKAAQCATKPCCAAANGGCCAEKPAAAPTLCAAAHSQSPTCEKQLIKLIQASVKPDSWADAGGRGTIEYMPIGMSIAVNQTPEVQEQVAELLDALRRVQDLQVAVEVRVMSVGDCLFEQIAGDFGLSRQPTAFLDSRSVSQFLERLQGDTRAHVMQAPKLTTFSGQEAIIRAGDEQFFVTGLSLDKSSRQVTGVPGATASTQTIFVPQNQAFWTGLTMTLQPTVTPDRHTVLLKLQAEISELTDANVPLFPVTALVTPVFEGGAQGQPVPFTQFLQQPTIMKRGITKVVGIPDGQTAVFSAGRGTRTVMDVDYCPVLGHIPFVCELFKTETPRQESDHLVFLVTPRVIVNVEQKACAVKCCDEQKCGVCPACRPAPHCAAPAEQAAPAPCPVTAAAAWAPEQLPMPVARPAVPPVQSCPAAIAPCEPVVRAAPAAPMPLLAPVPDQVELLLQNQVQLDVVLIDVEDAFFTRPEGTAWADLAPKSCTGRPLVVSPEVAERFCASARQLKAAQCLATPKLVTRDGRPATFLSGGYQAFPEVTAAGAGGPVGARFEPFGALLTFRPFVCPADAVKLEFDCHLSNLNDAKGFNINGTRVAGRDEQRMNSSIEVAPGRTIVMHIGPGAASGTTMMLLVTPSVIHPAVVPMPVAMAVMPAPLPVAEEQAVPPPPPVDPKLARLMRRYYEACDEGRTSAAKKLAAKCLEIDPTCFGRD
jgi:Flp pilus assembly secretin CpaC